MVYIAQLLCPQRHAIVVLAHVCESENEVEILAASVCHKFADAIAAKILNPYCDLCGSTDLHVETGRTRWATLEEAMPHLKASEEAQRQTAIILKAGKN